MVGIHSGYVMARNYIYYRDYRWINTEVSSAFSFHAVLSTTMILLKEAGVSALIQSG